MNGDYGLNLNNSLDFRLLAKRGNKKFNTLEFTSINGKSKITPKKSQVLFIISQYIIYFVFLVKNCLTQRENSIRVI
ncbi:MAG: hypothetical protein K0Q48_1738 [Bacillota bacterium]|nr:hypothetical protein [Bacillota bacterium]